MPRRAIRFNCVDCKDRIQPAYREGLDGKYRCTEHHNKWWSELSEGDKEIMKRNKENF